jgi:hypothetical protein
MRKTFILAAAMLSVFLLASVDSPEPAAVYSPKANTSGYALSDTLSWKLLGQIKFIKKANDDYPEGVMYPVVNSTLKAKQGKPIVMSGFIIPIDNKSYALSKNVFASCFFCGQAGPETIMGIKFKNTATKLKTDQYVTLSGTFRYNDADVDDWIYHIDNAVVVSK